MKSSSKKSNSKLKRTFLILAIFSIILLVKLNIEKAQFADNAGSIRTPLQANEAAESSIAALPIETHASSIDIEKEKLIADIKELSMLYKDIYTKADKITSPHYGDSDTYISQAVIDEIENRLIDNGYTVMNSDSVYPAYIENPEVFYSFWENVELGKNADADFWGVAENGGLYYRRLRYYNGAVSCLNVSSKWNELYELELASYEQRAVFNHLMTDSGDYLYRDLMTDRHWTAAKLLRLHPVESYLYDLYLKYIEPIGYHNVNIFLSDWDSDDFSKLCFNDLLSGLYYADYSIHLDTTIYPFIDGTEYNAIPADSFEKAILHHFDISKARLRQLAHYDAEYNAYPYNSYVISYDSYYPSMIADVADCVELGNGKIKLTVNVMCPDLHCQSVFKHELTVQQLPDGDYKYLSNRVIFKENIEQPSAKPGVIYND